jgi:hypothetical protein
MSLYENLEERVKKLEEDLRKSEEVAEVVKDELTPEKIKKLIENARETEWKYMLKLKIMNRRGGCGYVYLYSEELKTVYGDAEFVELVHDEQDCTDYEEVLVIPKTVPTVVMKIHRDENPECPNYVDIFVFTSEGWKWLTTRIPK